MRMYMFIEPYMHTDNATRWVIGSSGEVGRDNTETKPRQNRDKTQSKIRAGGEGVHSKPRICPASIRRPITQATRSYTHTPLFREFPVWAPLPQTPI